MQHKFENKNKQIGVLITNLGTPDSPTKKDLKKYHQKLEKTQDNKIKYNQKALNGNYDLIYRFNEKVLNPEEDLSISESSIKLKGYKDIKL